MIKHNGKLCTAVGCNMPLFAKGYCLYHYKSIHLANKQKLNKNKPYLTKRRQSLNKRYSEDRELFINNKRSERKDRKVFCIFCGGEIKGEPSLHHALGRDDSVMLNTAYWFLAHNECHVRQYHSMSWQNIPWWNEYLYRIKDNEKVYNKELRRMNKTDGKEKK